MKRLFEIPFDRDMALNYAHRWAYGRNPVYYDFEKLGGDCTNFASQCIFAGSGLMNYTPVHGWYYRNSHDRSPSWTGVNFLYNFLINNKGLGPYAALVDAKETEPGDIVQLSFKGGGFFQHSPLIVRAGASQDEILVATHSDDVDYYPLSGYTRLQTRFIHILGVRVSV